MRTKFLLFLVLFVYYNNYGLATDNFESDPEPQYIYFDNYDYKDIEPVRSMPISSTITSTTTTTTTTTSTTPRTTSRVSSNLNELIGDELSSAEATTTTLPPPLIMNTTTIALVTERDDRFSKFETTLEGEYETILNTLREIGTKDESKDFRFVVTILFTILCVCALVCLCTCLCTCLCYRCWGDS